jgi:hypothetical protein
MPVISSCNSYLDAQLSGQHVDLLVGGAIHLYVNNLVPSPVNVLGDFAEASFPGYAPIALLGKITVPRKLRDGVYSMAASPLAFLPSADDAFPVYGWYVTLAGSLAFAMAYGFPVPIINGQQIMANFNLDEWDLATARN